MSAVMPTNVDGSVALLEQSRHYPTRDGRTASRQRYTRATTAKGHRKVPKEDLERLKKQFEAQLGCILHVFYQAQTAKFKLRPA